MAQLPVRPLKIMHDIDCDPIWWDSSHPAWPHWNEIGPIDPASLGLSAALVADLRAWAAAGDALIDPQDPGAPAAGREAFEEAGARLAERLAAELGASAAVRYAL